MGTLLVALSLSMGPSKAEYRGLAMLLSASLTKKAGKRLSLFQ